MDKRYMKLVKLFIVTLSLVILYITVKYAFPYIYPFLIAAQLAYLLHPVVTFLEKNWRMNRTLATLLIILTLFASFFLFCFIILKYLITESSYLIDKLPIYLDTIKDLFQRLIEFGLPIYDKLVGFFPFLTASDQLKTDEYLASFIDQLGNSSVGLISTVISTSTYMLSSITYILTVFIFILIFVFIMTKDMPYLISQFKRLVPRRITIEITAILASLRKTFFGFIKAQIIIAAISASIVLIGLLLFKFDHIVIITIAIFFIDLIPYIGIGVIFIPWLLSTFFTEQYMLTIQLGSLYVFIILVRQFIEPKIIASTIGIHPLISLTTLFIGIQIFGLLGIFLAPIILIMLSALYHARIFHYIWYFIQR